jgi:hypothetical protein
MLPFYVLHRRLIDYAAKGSGRGAQGGKGGSIHVCQRESNKSTQDEFINHMTQWIGRNTGVLMQYLVFAVMRLFLKDLKGIQF